MNVSKKLVFLESISFFLASVLSVLMQPVFYSTQPDGLGEVLGATVAAILVSCVIAGVIVAIRLIWTRANLVQAFFNSAWVVVVFVSAITIKGLSFNSTNASNYYCLLPFVFGFWIWFSLREILSSVKISEMSQK